MIHKYWHQGPRLLSLYIIYFYFIYTMAKQNKRQIQVVISRLFSNITRILIKKVHNCTTNPPLENYTLFRELLQN